MAGVFLRSHSESRRSIGSAHDAPFASKFRAPARVVGARMSVQMELNKIIISEMQESQIIVLKEVDGERKFPIVIGGTEAMAIDRRLKGIPTPRPMTHDLLASVIEQLGGTIER